MSSCAHARPDPHCEGGRRADLPWLRERPREACPRGFFVFGVRERTRRERSHENSAACRHTNWRFERGVNARSMKRRFAAVRVLHPGRCARRCRCVCRGTHAVARIRKGRSAVEHAAHTAERRFDSCPFRKLAQLGRATVSYTVGSGFESRTFDWLSSVLHRAQAHPETPRVRERRAASAARSRAQLRRRPESRQPVR